MGIGATLAAALRSLHYLALMNQRASGVVLLIILLGAAYFMLSGQAYELWMRRG